jgi:hypothetical protein
VDDILPPDPDLQPLHTRHYEVRAFKIDDDTMLLRGGVRDTKPAGLYIPDDAEPLVMHHMVVELRIAYPSLEITDARVVLETHPHTSCTRIEDHYRSLIGLSIARGFTHKVRELFGGPRGCTHTTALLQAMAPVAVQTTWSMRAPVARDGVPPERRFTQEARTMALRANANTCHVWAEDGEMYDAVSRGEVIEIPLPVARRLRDLGREPTGWIEGGD